MFGYVRINKPELRVREYDAYRAVYCGLCHAMGKCTGCASRLSLSYDFAFLAALRAVIGREQIQMTGKRCIAHPTVKRPVVVHSEAIDFAASAAALLTYYKVKDDLSDESGGKRLRARLLLPTARRMRKRALRREAYGRSYTVLDRLIGDGMDALAALEREPLPSVDIYAEAFGRVLGEIFAFGLTGSDGKLARAIGEAVGKWIYLLDALDDFPEDREKKRFNPYHHLWEGKDPDTGALSGMRIALTSELIDAEKAIDLVDFSGYGDFSEIIRNIIYLGMPGEADKVLCRYKEAHGAHAKDQPTDDGRQEGE